MMATFQSSRQHAFHSMPKPILSHQKRAKVAKESTRFLSIQGKLHGVHVYFRLTLKFDDGLTENCYDILWI